MKAIILASSIFYILGLKISNKIDLIKKTSPVDTVVTHTVTPKLNVQNIDFSAAEKELKVVEPATTKSDCSSEESM